MEFGFRQGRTLIQEEWAHPKDIIWANELISEGKAIVAVPWTYHEEIQCYQREIRGIRPDERKTFGLEG